MNTTWEVQQRRAHSVWGCLTPQWLIVWCLTPQWLSVRRGTTSFSKHWMISLLFDRHFQSLLILLELIPRFSKIWHFEKISIEVISSKRSGLLWRNVLFASGKCNMEPTSLPATFILKRNAVKNWTELIELPGTCGAYPTTVMFCCFHQLRSGQWCVRSFAVHETRPPCTYLGLSLFPQKARNSRW